MHEVTQGPTSPHDVANQGLGHFSEKMVERNMTKCRPGEG